MSVFVYAIYSKMADQIYVGISANTERRLQEHNRGKSRYTKAFCPWVCFHKEEFSDYSEARDIEKKLKTSRGKSFLREQLKNI